MGITEQGMFSSTDLRMAQYAPLAAMPPHSHDDASFGVIVGGDFVERIGKSERRYESGFVTFGPAGVTHSQQFGADGAKQIIITPDDAWLDYLADCRMPLADAPFAQTADFQRLGVKLAGEMAHDDTFSAIARESIVLEIIAAFGRMGVAPSSSTQPPAWLRAARDFLRDNAGETLGMKKIARAVGRHEIHLAREFRRYFGLSIGAYLRRVRSEKAAGLLLRSRADITQIALACGFASHSHLCRVFKAHYGVSPSQYRARN
jgi:AraC family transcriptional regulator